MQTVGVQLEQIMPRLDQSVQLEQIMHRLDQSVHYCSYNFTVSVIVLRFRILVSRSNVFVHHRKIKYPEILRTGRVGPAVPARPPAGGGSPHVATVPGCLIRPSNADSAGPTINALLSYSTRNYSHSLFPSIHVLLVLVLLSTLESRSHPLPS